MQEPGGMLPNVDLHHPLVYEVSFQYNVPRTALLLSVLARNFSQPAKLEIYGQAH